MAQPPAYTPVHAFVSDSATLANFPGQQLDVEFNDVKATTDAISANLKLIQRDDGAIANASVDLDQLTTNAKAQLGNTAAITTLVASSATAVTAAATATADVVLTHADVVLTHADAVTTASNAAAALTSANNAAATLATAVVGPAASVDGEVMLYSGTTGKLAKRATAFSGLLKMASGVASAAVAGTDYQAADAQLFSNIPQNSKSAAYTTVLTDGQKHIFHPAADTTARIWTIDSNANVAYPIGTAITFINQNAAGIITIAITSDTMRLAGTGATGSRALAANGMATAIKVTATEWIISGTGLT